MVLFATPRAKGGARKTSNHHKTSIFLLYLHKVIIFNMSIEIVQKLLKSEGHALSGCYCLTNPKASGPFPFSFF